MKRIPVARPSFSVREERALIAALRSGWWTQGPRVEEFEKATARAAGTRHAVAVTSCTTALFLMLKAIGVGEGDEVVVPSLSFIATANAVLHAGARPVFADIDPKTYNIDPKRAAERMTRRTRAILAVHQVGLPADVPGLRRALRDWPEAVLLEDAACAIGAERGGKPCGSFGRMAAFSFHPRKIVSTGEGGAVVTNDAALAARLREMRAHGASVSDRARHEARGPVFESYSELGYNFRMTDLQAAVGVEQMCALPKLIERRRRLAERYDRAFAGMKCVSTPFVPRGCRHVYQSYMVRLDGVAAERRDRAITRMEEGGVSVRRGVMAIHREPVYRKLGGRGVSLPETERAADETLILPLFADMTAAQQERVVKEFLKALAEEGIAESGRPRSRKGGGR